MGDGETGVRKRGGQPKPDAERKRGNLTFRVRDALRAKLEAAAVRFGRSVSEEIEARLELSESRKDQLTHEWGEDFIRIATSIASALSHIEDTYDCKWYEKELTAELFKLTSAQLIQNYKDQLDKNGRELPRGLSVIEDEPPEIQAQIFARLGGLPPPRIRSKPVEIEVSDE